MFDRLVRLDPSVPIDVPSSFEYAAISEFYGNQTATRSGVPYMSHINEGINILRTLNADVSTMKAFAIHPIVQSDRDFRENLHKLTMLNPVAVAMAVEYRNVANSYLSKDYHSPEDKIRLSSLPEVNLMLLADKVQNFRDLKRYNVDHPRYDELCGYFHNWLRALDVKLGRNTSLTNVR